MLENEIAQYALWGTALAGVAAVLFTMASLRQRTQQLQEVQLPLKQIQRGISTIVLGYDVEEFSFTGPSQQLRHGVESPSLSMESAPQAPGGDELEQAANPWVQSTRSAYGFAPSA